MPRRAAQRASGAVDEPNVILPLAFSYNERGVQGFTHTVTNSEDQRKVNVFYETVRNAATGKGTLTLCKRPGVAINAISCGSSTQTPYAILTSEGRSVVSQPIVFSVSSGGDITGSESATPTTILTPASGQKPYIADKTSISSIENLVLQTRTSTTSKHRVFYSTDNITWTEIVDVDFTGLIHAGKMEHMDGFAFILADTNRIWNSDSNSLANWTATSFITKAIRQDYPVGLARLKNQILAFGDRSVEMFYNATNTVGSPLGRIPQLSQDIGLVGTISGGTNYYATIENKIFFVGRKSGGLYSVGVFAYDGANFDKVSTMYIDKILNEKADSLASVTTFGFMGHAAVAINWTIPGTTSLRWLMFFPEWREWFEWTSDIFSPVNSGSWFLGISSGNTNKVYNFTASDNWQDNGTSYAWSTQFKLPMNGSSTKFMPMYGVDADTDTVANNLTVEISTTDPQVFSTLGTIDQTQDRKVLFEGGSFTKAWIRLGNTNARPTRIHSWLARIE